MLAIDHWKLAIRIRLLLAMSLVLAVGCAKEPVQPKGNPAPVAVVGDKGQPPKGNDSPKIDGQEKAVVRIKEAGAVKEDEPIQQGRTTGRRHRPVYMTEAKFISDGQRVLIKFGGPGQLWDLKTLTQIPVAIPAFPMNVVEWLPDGKHLLAANADTKARASLCLWDMCTGKLVRTLSDGENEAITCLAVSADGKYALSGNEAGDLKQWNIADGKRIWAAKSNAPIMGIKLLPNNRALTRGYTEYTHVRLWDVAEGKQLPALPGQQTPVQRWAAASKNARQALTATSRHLKRHDVKTGKTIWEVEVVAPPAHISAVAFSQNGNLALIGSDAGAVTLWDAVEGKFLRVLAVTSGERYAGGPNDKIILAALRKNLKDPNAEIRRDAVTDLAKFRGTVPLLIEAASDKNPLVRAQAADALGWAFDPQSKENQDVQGALLKLLADQDALVRLSAACTLLGSEAHGESALKTLGGALQDKDASIRMQATKTLQGAGTDALPLLEKAMKDENAEIRREATELYLSIHLNDETHRCAYGDVVRKPIPMPLLLEALSDADPRLRRLSSSLLAAIAYEDPCAARLAIPALTKALKDKELVVQMQAVRALLRLGQKNPGFLPVLLEAARDEYLSHQAYWIMERMQPDAKDAVPVLIKMLEHPNGNVGVGAATMLGKIGPPAVPELIKLLERRNDGPACLATSVLYQIGPEAKAAVPVLIRRLKFLQGPNNESEKAFVAEILGRMGPDARAAVPTLVKLMQDTSEPGYARVQYIRAIRSIGPSAEAIPDFLQALKTGEPFVRDEVRWIFPLIGPEGIPPLLKVIANAQEPPAFRVACIRVLADMRPDPKDATPVLHPLLDDGNADIRSAAHYSLARIEADAAKKAKNK